MGHKKASSTLIDDCVEKFRQHETERKRLRLLNGQRGSTETVPVDLLLVGDGDPLSTALSSTTEEPETPGLEDMTTGDAKHHWQTDNQKCSTEGLLLQFFLKLASKVVISKQ